MDSGTRAPAATVQCAHCGECLAVPHGGRPTQCALCHGVTRVERHRALHGAVGIVKGVFASIVGGGTRQQQLPARLWEAGYPRVHGKKRALLVGINYTGREDELTGPINDVKCMNFLLCHKFGFPSDSVLVLTDEERDPHRRPTKSNILLAMRWLVHGCSSGDSLVFHFSGHGVQVADADGDELDGKDEAICPLDYCGDERDLILDDEINEAIVRPLVHGVRLHAIIDACNSGTVLDLPNLCRISRNGHCKWEDHSPPTGASKHTTGGHAILISGCTDAQLSDDRFVSAPSMGALTYSFFTAVWSEARTDTYGHLLTVIRAIIRHGGAGRSCTLPAPLCSLVRKIVNFSGVQEPQLSSSQVFDIYRQPFEL